MVSRDSGDLRGQVGDYIGIDGLNEALVGRIADYLTTMHNLGEGTKEVYLVRLRRFGLFLKESGGRCFEDADKALIDLFLSNIKNHGTINGYITTLKPFYRDFLKRGEVVKDLKCHAEELQPISPSELLTVDEVVSLAEESGRRREMYKVASARASLPQ